MRAITIPEFGDEQVLTLADVPDPTPGPGDVLIDVAAAGVNRADLLQRKGFYDPPAGASPLPGLEVSGTVAAVGADVTDWRPGDRVCALLTGGGYAQQVVVPAGQVLPVPEGVDLVDAAGLPEVVCTVWSNVFDTARLRAGDVLLIHGGSSGIGTMAIQLAVAAGATVAVTAGTAAKLDACRDLGATILINYREEDFVTELSRLTDGHGADVILDVIGAKYLDRNVSALADGGRLVVIGLQGGATAELNLGKLMATRGSVIGTTLRSRTDADKARVVAGVREQAWPLIEAGTVRPIIFERVPFAEAPRAHRILADSHHVGKVLLVP
ncbi:NAD(P)H-quinone oxidoreductase [Millisia brevis]|uniref:NAD(P)H-quinone oxidoreductase n=1 Tax=Millisia brevis TaxID=264148 RepID=UPI00082F04E3|nr:NAD(P)H-quinone oxidoreductase [Millisia brevis]